MEVSDHTSMPLMNIILTYITPESKTVTDSLKKYHSLGDNFPHLTGTRNDLKIKNSHRDRTKSYYERGELKSDWIENHLDEFQWRKKPQAVVWGGFINSLIVVQYL
ncbi:hypothetical protein HZS_4548 [Henneguya salminicola]|nr:hypothetical protein HZS_4548 [Henneguya salminicola]